MTKPTSKRTASAPKERRVKPSQRQSSIVAGGIQSAESISLTRSDRGPAGPLIPFRPYQEEVFWDDVSGVLILHWSRQIGKSYVLASWAVNRLLTRPGRLVTVLSNSKDNGAEFAQKCSEVCNKLGLALAQKDPDPQIVGDAAVYVQDYCAPDIEYEQMRFEIRITVKGQTGRIKVLAANPRTARGFSGDLILDEFAFHEDSNAIWEAAEPILSSNPDFLCRIASTGNGKHNMFFRMVHDPQFKVISIKRSDAWRQGVKVYDPNTRLPITPEEARAKALDKRAYDQNYENAFNDENMTLLSGQLIDAAQRSLATVDSQQWSPVALARMHRAAGNLFAGLDIGRTRDISVLTVLEVIGRTKRVVGMLRMEGMRLPDQQKQVDPIVGLPKFRGIEIDMTGIGLGLVEYLQQSHGLTLVRGVNFSSTEKLTPRLLQEGRKAETARVTEIMAVDLLGEFEDRAIEIPIGDRELNDDLRKPERITSPGGRVSIAAVRDEAGHADHFWSLALANRASSNIGEPLQVTGIAPRESTMSANRKLMF